MLHGVLAICFLGDVVAWYDSSDRAGSGVLEHVLDTHYWHWHAIQGIHRNIGPLEGYFSEVDDDDVNVIRGLPNENEYDLSIRTVIPMFSGYAFSWYMKEEGPFGEALLRNGFRDDGQVRGVIGSLEESSMHTAIAFPEGYYFQMVTEKEGMEQAETVIDRVFHVSAVAGARYKDIMWEEAQKGGEFQWVHWVARKQRGDHVVAVVSTMVQGGVVSIWNMATVPEERKQGLGTALILVALQHAYKKRGARYGGGFLTPTSGAVTILKENLGFQEVWHLHKFVYSAGNR